MESKQLEPGGQVLGKQATTKKAQGSKADKHKAGASLKGYIVYSTYRIIDKEPVIYLFGRLENGESVLCMPAFRPFFYIKKEDAVKAKAIFDAAMEGCDMKDFEDKPVVAVYADKPSDVPDIRKMYENEGITCYEADIRFTQRYWMEKGIFGTISISGEYKEGHYVDRIYEKPEIVATEEFDIRLKTLAFDIETDYNAEEVYSISLYSQGVSEVLIVSDKKLKNAVSYGSELELLQAFSRRIMEIDPDIITGWNIIDFDLNVLQKRFKYYNIPFHLGRADWDGKIRKEQSFFRDSTAEIPGRQVMDGIALLKMSFIALPDYRLDTAAEELLGENKIQIGNLRENITRIFREEPQKLADYNLKDSQLAYDIVIKKKLIELTMKKAMITGMPLDKVKGSVASLDSLYIRKAHARGYVCPTSSFSEREERVKGAFVMEPRPGVYDYVGVLDFKSLYPSIIRTYNIDPISHRKDGTIVAPNGARFMNGQGVLPEIIAELWKERDRAKKEKDKVKSNAIKIIMNSFYGVLANPSCRFYNLEMANAITSFARETIKETAALLEKKGFTVLYGDTDSVFVDFKEESEDEARQKGAQIAEYINSHFTAKVKEQYGRESVLELEFEKIFKVFLLPRMRGSVGGAKKRYAGLLIDHGEENIQVTGMEIVRRDWTELAKEVQMELLDRVFHKKEVAGYVKNIVQEIRKGKHDSRLVYRKSIRKDLEEYTKTTPPHVKAARMLPKLESSIIEYYMTVNGPEPVQIAEKNRSKLDYEHYIEKQIRPIAETILSLFGQNFDDLIAGSNQKNLFDFS